jgi:hypothetical protein
VDKLEMTGGCLQKVGEGEWGGGGGEREREREIKAEVDEQDGRGVYKVGINAEDEVDCTWMMAG